LAGQIGDIEIFDAARRILAGGQALPSNLVPATERRDKTQACDDDTSHRAFA
jgi:hypothetical protein